MESGKWVSQTMFKISSTIEVLNVFDRQCETLSFDIAHRIAAELLHQDIISIYHSIVWPLIITCGCSEITVFSQANHCIHLTLGLLASTTA